MHIFRKLKHFAIERWNKNYLKYFNLHSTLDVSTRCVYCVWIGHLLISIIISCIQTNACHRYLLNTFVTLFVYHQRHFWIAFWIMIIYVKMYLAFSFPQLSWYKSKKRLSIFSFPLMFYFNIRVKGSKLIPSCNLKTRYKKCS